MFVCIAVPSPRRIKKMTFGIWYEKWRRMQFATYSLTHKNFSKWKKNKLNIDRSEFMLHCFSHIQESEFGFFLQRWNCRSINSLKRLTIISFPWHLFHFLSYRVSALKCTSANVQIFHVISQMDYSVLSLSNAAIDRCMQCVCMTHF